MNALDHLLLQRYRESVASGRLPADTELRDFHSSNENKTNQELPAPQRDEQEPTINLVHDAFAGLLGQPNEADLLEAEADLLEAEADLLEAEAAPAFSEQLAEKPIDSENMESEPPISDQPIAPSRTPFKPEWEVDRFLWPPICEDVEQRLESELAAVLETVQSECQLHLCNVVAVASTDAGSGGTTMSLCLAREAARQGLSVALIDLHHARPMVADRLGVACEQGIESLPLESVEPQNICIAAVEDHVSLVPLVRPVDSAFCGSRNIQALINEVATQHDLVLLDTSPEVIDVMVKENQCRGFGVIWVSSSEETEELTYPMTLPLSDQRDDVWTVGVIRNQAA